MKFPKKLFGLRILGSKVSVFRNTTKKRFGKTRVPAQVLLYAGPWFVLVK